MRQFYSESEDKDCSQQSSGEQMTAAGGAERVIADLRSQVVVLEQDNLRLCMRVKELMRAAFSAERKAQEILDILKEVMR